VGWVRAPLRHLGDNLEVGVAALLLLLLLLQLLQLLLLLLLQERRRVERSEVRAR